MKSINKCPSYKMIREAVSGNETAIMDLLKYYDAYISKLCLRPIYSTSNKVNMIVDMELKGRIQTELMKAILKFELKVK